MRCTRAVAVAGVVGCLVARMVVAATGRAAGVANAGSATAVVKVVVAVAAVAAEKVVAATTAMVAAVAVPSVVVGARVVRQGVRLGGRSGEEARARAAV